MSASDRLHRLVGLQPDNLLAFLTLVGLLRALETARPQWRPRAYWMLEREPLRPALELAVAAEEEALAEAAADGVGLLAEAHRFDRSDVNWSAEEIRALQTDAENDPLRRRLLGALGCDAAVRDDKDATVWPTPLCLMFGQGHQHFLSRLEAVPNGRLPTALGRSKRPPDLRSPEYLRQALFEDWRRADPTDGFRWDPAEDRRYALRARNPSGDSAGMQHGANVLAAVALPVLTGAAVVRRGATRFLVRGSRYASDGRIRFVWPLWRPPARLTAISALLAHPALGEPERRALELRRLGVEQVASATRISVGKFFSISAGALTELPAGQESR